MSAGGEAMSAATEALDLDCHSVRDVLNLIGAVRQAKPRDPLRALEDVLLDLVVDAQAG